MPFGNSSAVPGKLFSSLLKGAAAQPAALRCAPSSLTSTNCQAEACWEGAIFDDVDEQFTFYFRFVNCFRDSVTLQGKKYCVFSIGFLLIANKICFPTGPGLA